MLCCRYNLAQQKLEDSSGCESGIRAGMSSQDPSCSESETNAAQKHQSYKVLEEHSVTTDGSADHESAMATAGNNSCLEIQTVVSETATMATESTSTTTATFSNSIQSPISMTTTLHTQSTETNTTADSAVADMATTDNHSANAQSIFTDNTSSAFLSAEYLQRIVDKQLEELYSDSTSKDRNESIHGTIASTPFYETDEDVTPPRYQDIGSVVTGSSYQQYLTDHLYVPRYSAMPRTASMEVHPSSCNISESEGESLVDSLDDPMSPRPSVRHDNKLVRGCVMELSPDITVQQHKVDRGEAFFIPIREERGKIKENVAEMLPEKLRERLVRREKKRMLRKEHALRKKQKRMQRSYEQQQFRDKERFVESFNPKQIEIHKPKVQIKTPVPSNIKRKRTFSRDDILKLESYRIDGRGEMRIDTPREHRLKKNDCPKKKISKTRKEQESASSTELIPYNTNESRNQVQSGSSSETAPDTGPRRVYQKTEIQDGEKTIEILEIVECIESSPEVIPICMYKNHYKSSSKIPVPVYRSGTNVYTPQKQSTSSFNRSGISKTNTPNTNSNIDKLIAKILIDALNNKSDEVHFLKSVQKSPKDRKSIDVVSSSKASHVGFKRSTLPQIRRSANQRFLQKFEVIPEERGSISMESSAEETVGNNANKSSLAVGYVSEKEQCENNQNDANLPIGNQVIEPKDEKNVAKEGFVKLKEMPKTCQDQSTQIYNEEDIDEKLDIEKNNSCIPKINEKDKSLENKNDSTQAHNNTINEVSQSVLKITAETQTDNDKVSTPIKEIVTNISKPATFTNDKYVQTINLQSSSSQTSPLVTPKIVSLQTPIASPKVTSQEMHLKSSSSQTSPIATPKVSQTSPARTPTHKVTQPVSENISKQPTPIATPKKVSQLSEITSKQSDLPVKASNLTSQHEKTDQKSNPPKLTAMPKGKRTKSNPSIVSTENTTVTETTKTKDKTIPKITVKKVSVLKSTTSKENLSEADKQSTNVKRSTIRRTRNSNSVSQNASEEPSVSFKTKTKHINEVRTRLKSDNLCDCLGCCMSSDDGDCGKSQAGVSCSCCARTSHRSVDECTYCDGIGNNYKKLF